MEPQTPPAESETPRYPFWGYADLFLFLALALPCLFLGTAVARSVVALLRIEVRNAVFVLVPGQFLGYAILFGSLWLLFRLQHGQPFWRSLGFVDPGVPAWQIVWMGVGLAVAVALGALVLKTPDINSPMKEYLSSGRAVVLLAVFGTTLGPLCEELAFRGFMQPLLVRTFGVVPGVLMAALPFGLLHLQQYGWSWRHGLLISLAGCAFGWMRHKSGSTRAAVVMHMAYNGTFFLALVAQRGELPHTW
jgi:membrane protease YdiL (CAAX protease family)